MSTKRCGHSAFIHKVPGSLLELHDLLQLQGSCDMSQISLHTNNKINSPISQQCTTVSVNTLYLWHIQY
jgi:hypothetical protein